MPIFESNGKKYNVQDAHIENFKAEHPDATAVLEREGKKFRVKVGDYGKFMQGVSAAPPAPKAEDINPTGDKSGYTFTAEELGMPDNTYKAESTSVAKLLEVKPMEVQKVKMNPGKLKLQGEALGNLNKEKEMLEAQLDEVRRKASERRKAITSNAGAYQFGMAPVTGNVTSEVADIEMAKLGATENQLEQAIREVDRKISGEDAGFWQGVLDATVRNPGFYTMGMSDMSYARAMLDLSENGINSETDLALADAAYENSVLQEEADRGFMYRAGNMFGHSIPFMVQMAASGGGTGISKLGGKAAQKFAKETLKHKILRATGVVADDLLESAFIANTAGAGTTQANILQRKAGQLRKDAQDGYYFEGKNGWLEAAAKGEMSSILEQYTEKFGNHLDGKLSITKGLDKIGAKRISTALAAAKNSDIGKAANTVLTQFGINGVLPEVMEEEANLVLNSIFVGDNKLSDLFDLQTQLDIVGGMFLTVGTMRAIPGAIGSVGYIRNQRKLNAADKEAEAVYGEKWAEMRERLNNASNEEVADVCNSMIGSGNDQALLDYYKRMMVMRGYNIGTTKREDNIPGAEQSYQEGYEAADEQKSAVKQAYDMERERVLNTFGEEVVQKLDDDPIGALMEMNEVDRQEAIDYVNARTAYEGMIDRISDDIDERIKASDKEIESHANRQDGAIHPAVMRGVNGAAPKRVYIVNGNVATFEDGTIDKANSSSMIIVRDAETGEVSAASADDLESLDAVIDTEAEKRTVAEQIANEYAGQQAVIIETESVNGEGENEVAPVVIPDDEAQPTVELTPAQKSEEVLKRIPTKGKERLWTEAEPADVAEYIGLLTADPAKQQAAADKFIADIKAKQAKVDAISALEMDEQIAYWESVKALLQGEQPTAETAPVVEETQAPVVESAPVEDNTPQSQSDSSPTLVEQPTPQATNEMQEADLTEDVKTEDVNRPENNLEMVAEGDAPGQSGETKGRRKPKTKGKREQSTSTERSETVKFSREYMVESVAQGLANDKAFVGALMENKTEVLPELVGRYLGANYDITSPDFFGFYKDSYDKAADRVSFANDVSARVMEIVNPKPAAGPKQVNVESLMGALKQNGEAKLSDHVVNPSGNKLVTDERYNELKERMKKKLKGQMNIGVDPEILAIGTEMAVYHIEKGARKFADFAKGMIADLGDAIRPYLKAFYNGARELPEIEEAGFTKDMTPYEEVKTFDVANFDKQAVDAMATAETVTRETEVAKDVEAVKAPKKRESAEGKKLRKATQEDLEGNPVVYYKGEKHRILMLVHRGEQTSGARFTKPEITRVYLENMQDVKVDDLYVEDTRENVGESGDNSVPSQQTPVNNLNENNDGREENTATDNSGAQPGREELPDTEQVGAGIPVQDTARNSKSKRRNAGVGSSELGNGPQYDVNRNYTNEEIEEIVSSVTDIVDGKVVITGEVTDDIKAIVRGYESGGIAKKGRGILDEYYTDGKIVDAVNLLIAPYFSGSTPIRVLEPSVGIGNFIQAVNNIPTSEVVAFEINETTARIAKILYPDVDVNLRSFETEFIDESGNKKPMPQKYSLVIGNPPYGSHRGLYKGLGEENKIARYEDYFVKRSLDVLDEGGVLAMVLPSSWMDRHTKFGGYTIERAYRLPSGAFEATQVGTDIVILKKDSSVPVTEHAPYFEQFPERILGEVKQRKGRYGRLEEYVEGDIDAAIEAIKKENAEQVADLLDIEKNNDALNDIESAVDETGSPEKAVAVVKDAQESEKAASKREQSTSSLDAMPSESGLRNAKADKKPAKKPSGKQGKYKVELNRGVETVPTSAQFTHEFSEGEVEAFADTDYEGALSNPAKHRRYANYIGGQAIHDFYYAEGDIYSKLAQLEQEKDYIVENYGVEQYEKQKALLESVLPKQKSLEEITISPNTTFVKNLNILTEGGRVSLKDMFVDFLRKLPHQAFGESSPWEVIAYINNEQVHGTDKSRNQRIRERRKRVANDLFNKFLSEELSDNAKKQVVAAFNREYNSTYRPDYSKVPMFSTINRDFKGKPLRLTSVQLAGIGRMTVKGVGVLAHEVGFGKTLSGILAMHEAMTRGFAKKPLIVVPNDNILKQWVETIGEVLPNATINVLGNLGAGYDLTDFKVNDGEFTIITYEGLKAMSFSDGTYDHLAARFSYITEDLNKHQSERDIQKEIEKKKELKGKMKRGTKPTYLFEDFGFDWLTVDEVHNANHIVSKVRLDKSVASDFRSQSQRTSDLGLKTWLAAQYIQEENNGRNVLLLSATPFTNKPLEYYSILSLVGNDMLERKGFFNVDQFFATFMEADNELEIGANGRPMQKTNVRRFRNNGLFQQLLSEFIDIKGEEDNPELVRPERLNKEYKIAQNELTAEAMAAAQELLSDNDTVLQGIGHARAAAFSPYATSLLGRQPKNHVEFVRNSPKIDATIRMIEQNIKDRPDAGQIIYSEVGVEYFPLIRDYLVKESGLKPSEVRIITGATSNNERVNIQTAFNNGEVKVVIGSPAIKEGLNLQGNTTDMYILSLPWNFTQLRQIEGRGWRQGNRWENIRINYMLTNDSVDVFMLQRLQLKQGLYNEAMKSGAESLDVSDIDTAELKTALITDPAVRAEIVTVQEREKLQLEKTQIEADLSFVMRKYEAYNKLVEKLENAKRTIKMYREWAQRGDEYWAQRAEREEALLPSLENEIEEEKQNLLKKGVNVDDIVRQTEQAQNAIAAIQEKIDNLKEFQEELTQKFREESEAKAKEQGDLVSTYIKERKAENKGGFYRIRPEKTETKATEEETEDDVLYRSSEDIEAEYPNWLEGTTTDSGKHSTQVEGTRKTYKKVGDWIEENMGKDVAILDASSGMGYGTADLRERGFDIEDVEPYQSAERKQSNPATYSSYADIEKQYDYIISNAVLNVIPDNWRADLLHEMVDKLKVGGKLFINTRKAGEERSIKDKIELDSPQEVLVKRNGKIASYQRFFTPQELKEWVESELGDGYTVEIANKANSGTNGLAAVVVTKNEDDVLYKSTEDVPRLNKHRIEKIFGGIWIDDAEEFAKFASAVNNYAFEENGQGVAYTDSNFYAYYLNIDGQVIPFASVALSAEESQEVVNQVNQEIENVTKGERAQFYFDRAYVRARNAKGQNNADNGNNNGAPSSRRNGGLVRGILRKGAYYDNPGLYVKTRRVDSFGFTAEELEERQRQAELSKRQKAKANEVLNALKEAGYNKFHIVSSMTEYGVSTYIVGDMFTPYQDIKLRISDHAVTSERRQESEFFYDFETPVSEIADRAIKAAAIVDKKAKDAEVFAAKAKERESATTEKWERIKDFFDGLAFYKTERTSQNFEEFSKDPNKSNILQTDLGNGMYRYEYTMPATAYGVKKPSAVYIEAFNEEIGEVETSKQRSGAGPLTDREVVMESDPYSKVLGKPRYYGKRQREFVARQRRRMAEKARQVAEKLNLDNVEVLESTEGLTGKKATSKGWFDPRTGKITVVVPNHGSTGDIVETVLHEAVAHYGLRKLFGENFKNFLDNVYRNVTPEIRAEITELAKKHGWDFHTATEEYLASLAENTNFERVNPSLWSNIKSFFMKMLAKVGITLDEPLGDNELRYILWRSHQNLVNPGWFNVFGQAEDIAKQYELGVGNYASGEVKTENGSLPSVAEATAPLGQGSSLAAEDEIRFREGGAPGSAREEYEHKVRRPNKSGSVGATENVAQRAQEAYQDSMLALKILQDAVARETGNEVKDNENAYIAENRMSSSNKAMVEIYERDFFMPLMDEINALIKEGVEYDDIIRYLHAKHGLERNEYMRRKQAEEAARRDLGEEPAMPNEGDADYEAKVNAKAAWRANLAELTESYVKKFAKRDYSGLTALTETANAKDAEAAAQQMVDEFENDHDTNPLWEAVNKATKETLRREFVGGLIDRATYDTVSTMFDFYIPLRGWDKNVAANEYEYFTNNNTPVFTPAIKTMHGRKSLSDDPIATIGYMAGSAIARANRNLMKQKFLNFVMNNPTSLATVSEQWYTMDYATNEWVPNNPAIPEDATPEQVVEIVEAHEANMRALEKAGKATRERSGLKIGLHATKQEEQQHVVRVMRNGKEYAVYINGNPRAAQALNGMTNPDVSKSKAREAAQNVKNFMARAFTSRNPAFIISNSVRDVIWAGTAVAAKEDAEYTKQYTKNVTGVLAKFKLPRLLRKFRKGTLDKNNKIERYFDEFLRNGGETGFTQVLTVEDYKKNITRFTKEAKNGTRISKKAWRGLWDGIEFLNRSAEDITRFTVYMTSRQMGRSIERSVYDAKEITVNFNKKGSGEMGAKYLNFAYIFFNATIQSLANFGKLVYRHPGKMAAALGTFGMMGFLMPVINAALMAMGDDDDEENYWNLPEWVRRNNIVLFVPWTEKGFITIPLPHEIRPFYGMGENAMSALLGKQTTEDAIKKSLVGFTGMLPIDFTANGGDVVVNVMPTILQPLAQVRANVTHFGTPIYKDNDFNKRYPSWTKAYKGTNSTLVAATKWLNELGGGNNVDSGGLLDWNPAVIEHLFESYLGGMGKTFHKMATTVSMLWDEEARIARNIPVASSFYQESDERTAGSQLNREYFDALEEMEGFQHRMSGYQKQITKGNAEYEKLFEDLVNSEEFMRYSIIKDYSNAISELNQVLKNNGPTEEEAQEIEGVIQELKNEMLDELEKLQAEE